MSGLHWEYYLIGKKHQPVVEEAITEYKRWMRGLRKFKKKYKCDAVLTNTFGLERTFCAVKFIKEPDPKIWRRILKKNFDDAYYPRKDTTQGKAVLAEFEALKRWEGAKVADAVGYNWLFWGGSVYPFNAGFSPKHKVMYFSIPKIPPHEKTPEPWYEPVAGVRKISYKRLEELKVQWRA